MYILMFSGITDNPRPKTSDLEFVFFIIAKD
jgi:hypothetical protein